MQNDFLNSFHSYLDKLKNEIELYPDDKSLWVVADSIINSGGNLCRHLTGNLNHFIGHGLGNTGYIRNRHLEFNIKDLSKAQLIQDVEEVKNLLSEIIPSKKLENEYPAEMWGKEMTVEQAFIKLLTHMTYHIGQVNYHRRLLSGK